MIFFAAKAGLVALRVATVIAIGGAVGLGTVFHFSKNKKAEQAVKVEADE